MPSKMRYRLGLDLGTTSIGWCMVRLNDNNQPVAIIRSGVRIFSDGRHPKTGTSLAVERRLARQMRRRRDRLLKRKKRMLEALVRLGFFPEDEKERKKLTNLDPYELRRKGLYEALSGPEFARALFHINQRRGFKSNRKTDKNDNDSGALKTAIRELKQKLEQEKCQTLGEWLAKRHKKGESVRARLRGKTAKERAYDFYVDRSMIEHEFEALWQKQRKFNPVLFNNDAHDELKDILLFQRNLKPVKVGKCTLMPEYQRAPLAMPSVQKFRIYQEVNNLRVLNDDLTENDPLCKEDRDKVVNLLETKRKATFDQIRKCLGLPGSTRFNLEDIKRKELKGNDTSATLAGKKYFGKRWHEFSLNKQDEIVDKILNEASEEKLKTYLKNLDGITDEIAENIANIRLKESYGRLSLEAISRILPCLMDEVITYDAAVAKAGLGSHSQLTHGETTGEFMDRLPYYGIPLQRHVAFEKDNPKNDEERYGKIANPTVHIGLNQVRRVVNALIKRYGKPDEIIVEVARDLKLSKQQKTEIQRQQAENQRRNETFLAEACQALELDPAKLDRAKRREISQKMQLWYELNPKDACNRKCPYTGEQISIEKLLSPEVEIEHILPYSRTLDDSMTNKTVSMRKANRDKGNKTPYEAFANHPAYDYESILQRANLMPWRKARRFAPDAYEKWLRNEQDFLARALNDTAYLSRLAREYLSVLYPPGKVRVRVIPGTLTAKLRAKFGLNQILSSDDRKNRDDHRHHAIDAAVVAVTDQGLLKRFADASARAREKGVDRLVEKMPMPWETYREHVMRAVNNIIVSHKPDHGYQGAMHEDSAWGIRKDGMVVIHKRDEKSGLRTREEKKKKLIEINSTRDPDRHGKTEDGRVKPYKGYVGGSNYCIEIWEDEKGKWKGDVISTYQAYQVVRDLGEEKAIKTLRDAFITLSGHPLVMRLMINDMVRMVVNDTKKLFRVVKIGRNGQVFFSEHFEANVDARNRNKEDPYTYISKTASTLKKANACKVTVSEIGDIHM